MKLGDLPQADRADPTNPGRACSTADGLKQVDPLRAVLLRVDRGDPTNPGRACSIADGLKQVDLLWAVLPQVDRGDPTSPVLPRMD